MLVRTEKEKVSTSTANLEELIRRIHGGDRGAEEELMRRVSVGLASFFQRITRDPCLAEDLRQETLMVILEKARCGAIREPERVLGFMRTTARRLYAGLCRKMARYRASGDFLEPGTEEFAGSGAPPPQLRTLLRREEAKRLRHLLGEMRFARDREILTRFYLAGDNKEEICEVMAVAPEHFKKVLFHARKRLRELWQRRESRLRLLAEGWPSAGRGGGGRQLR